MDNLFRSDLLKDKVIVVSGGTKGLGRLIVSECLKYGAKVIFGGRDKKSADAILQNTGIHRKNCKFVLTKLDKLSDCKKLFDSAVTSYGKIDGFVNYSGVTPIASLTECDEEVFDNVCDVNIKAPFFCCQYAINHMVKNKKGSIILVGSPHSSHGDRDRAIYACSKGFLYTLFEHISHNYAKDGIRCNLLTMGWTLTEGELALRKSENISAIELEKLAMQVIPMGRMLKEEDYIPGVLYLLSDYSSMATGSNLRVTGGHYI